MDPLDQEKVEGELSDGPSDDAPGISEPVENGVNGRFAFSSLAAVRKKLLDLTGRNQLLNYKHPKVGCVRVIDELPDQLYKRLLEGNALNFIPVPDPTEKELLEAGYIEYHAVSSNKCNSFTRQANLPAAPGIIHSVTFRPA